MDERYKDLACAVIKQAFDDIKDYAISRDSYKREYIRVNKDDAERFLFSDRLDTFLKTYELKFDPSYLRNKAKEIL